MLEVAGSSPDVTYSTHYQAPALAAKAKTALLGLIATKFGATEGKDDIKHPIEAAAGYAPSGQLGLSSRACQRASRLISGFDKLRPKG
jgi:vacuolar-type H+-ATPase subunit B/Vma2